MKITIQMSTNFLKSWQLYPLQQIPTAEMSFSTLRRLKTYLRNTMAENRLNIQRTVKVNPEEVLNELAKRIRKIYIVLKLGDNCYNPGNSDIINKV